MDTPAALPQLAEELRQTALIAGRQAARLLAANFRVGIQAEHKTNPHDLVTEVDRRSQLLLTEELTSRFPDSWVLGEEQLEDAAPHNRDAHVQWIVDPLDGTSNFVHGIAFFCVSIAAAIDDKLVAAVIIDPVSGDEFSANLQAAFLNERPLTPGPRPEQHRANLMTDYPAAEAIASDGPFALEIFGQWVLDFATVRRKVSAALALAHVAAGWCDATIGFDTNPWDIAAGAHLVRMSGGKFQGLPANQAIAAHLAPGFLATGPDADFPTLTRSAQRVAAHRAIQRQATGTAETR